MKDMPVSKLTNVKLLLPVIINAGCFIIAIAYKSRSFFIGYTVSIIFIFLLYKKFSVNKRTMTGLVVLLTGLLWLLVCCFKSNSSQGRLFIYKIACKILRDNFISGIGWGKFGIVYNQYQAAYFEAGHYTIKELLLADNIRYAYNDYLQLVIETGM